MTRWPAFAAAPLAIFAPAALAKAYLSIEQAQQAIFPGGSFAAFPISLTEAQKAAIENRSGVRVRSRAQSAWKVSSGGWFLVDQVLGKHELITYAVGLDADGSVRGIEIMEYLESYGDQIRAAGWRQQFAGKRVVDRLKLDDDIPNISGATLSCRHVTDGVKRLLALHEIVLKQL